MKPEELKVGMFAKTREGYFYKVTQEDNYRMFLKNATRLIPIENYHDNFEYNDSSLNDVIEVYEGKLLWNTSAKKEGIKIC